MRQTLFRLQLDSPFSTESIDGVPLLGIGWMAMPWAVFSEEKMPAERMV